MPSSVIKDYRYFPETEILRIVYQSGSIYDYFKVSQEIFDKFRAAKSKGQFLNAVIKQRFRFRKTK